MLKRRKFVVQNSRYLLLTDRGRYPNLASRVLSLCCHRLSQDWEAAFGYPVLAVESFVDPQRFSGTCYRAAGWEILGQTQGSRRHHRDFYLDDATPKELWVRSLHPQARKWLRSANMPPRFAQQEDPAMYCPYTAPEFRSLWERFNRLEVRELWATAVTPEEVGFCAAAQAVRIHRPFTELSTGKESDETVLGISSLLPHNDAAQNAPWLLDIARGHWTIENGNHYVRDRTYDEDRCAVRDPNSARILSTLRSLARFMAKKGYHRPRSAHQKTTPAFNRFCQHHRTMAIGWLTK